LSTEIPLVRYKALFWLSSSKTEINSAKSMTILHDGFTFLDLHDESTVLASEKLILSSAITSLADETVNNALESSPSPLNNDANEDALYEKRC
jgi:hypothetical protein